MWHSGGGIEGWWRGRSKVATGDLQYGMEPRQQPQDGENLSLRTANHEDEARLDIRATGFWSRGQEAFFDVRVFILAPPRIKTRNL